MWPNIRRRIRPEPDSVTAAPLLCMPMICMKLRNLRTYFSELMSVI